MSQGRTVAAAGAGVGLGAALLRAGGGFGDDAARIAMSQADDVARITVGHGALTEERLGAQVLGGRVLPVVGEGAWTVEEASLLAGARRPHGQVAPFRPVVEEESLVVRFVEEVAPDGVSAVLDRVPTDTPDRSVWLGGPRGTDFLVRLPAYRGATVGWVGRTAGEQVRVGDLTTSLSAIEFACAGAGCRAGSTSCRSTRRSRWRSTRGRRQATRPCSPRWGGCTSWGADPTRRETDETAKAGTFAR